MHPNACGTEKLSIHKHFLKKPTLFCFFLLSLRHITNSYNNNDEEKVIFERTKNLKGNKYKDARELIKKDVKIISVK